MDAIYCQKDISRQIIDAQADYVLALKSRRVGTKKQEALRPLF